MHALFTAFRPALVAGVLALLSAAPAIAATIPVTTTGMVVDTDDTSLIDIAWLGTGDNDDGETSLPEAIYAANNEAGADTIVLEADTYSITINTISGIQREWIWYGMNGLPPIASDITIEGNGATIERNGGSTELFRLFFISDGSADHPAAGTLTLYDLTLSGGLVAGGNGGSGSFGGGGGAGLGGAVFNMGTFTAERCAMTGNVTGGGSGGNANTAGENGGGGGGMGGNGGDAGAGARGGSGGGGSVSVGGTAIDDGGAGGGGALGNGGYSNDPHGAGGGGYSGNGGSTNVSNGDGDADGGGGAATVGVGDDSNGTDGGDGGAVGNPGGNGGFGGGGGGAGFTSHAVAGVGTGAGGGDGGTLGGGGGGGSISGTGSGANEDVTGGRGGDGGVNGGGGGGGAATTGGAVSTGGRGGNGGPGGGGGGGADVNADGSSALTYLGGDGGNGGFGGGGGGGGRAEGGTGGTAGTGGHGGFGGGAGAGGNNGAGGLPGHGGGAGGVSGVDTQFAGSGGGGASMGGAIFNNAGTVTLVNCTLSANSVFGGPGGDGGLEHPGDGGAGFGGAIFNKDGVLTLRNCTIAESSHSGGAGGASIVYGSGSAGAATGAIYSLSFNGSATIDISNTIIADTDTGDDVVTVQLGGTSTLTIVTSIAESSTLGGTVNGLFVSTDPMLDPLGDNGGPTSTHMIPAASAAVDSGTNGEAPVGTDQRGSTRIADAGSGLTVDLGAIERDIVNGVPVISAPALVDVPDGAVTLSVANGNAISFDDDSLTDDIEVVLTIAMGTLTLAQTDGLTSVEGNTENAVTLSGPLDAVNAALDGLVYDPPAATNDVFVLDVDVDDLGAFSDSGEAAESAEADVNMRVGAPVLTLPDDQTTDEDTALTFSTAGSNAITLQETDQDSNGSTLLLTVDDGTLTLAQTTGLSIDAGADGSATMTITGSTGDLNAALDGLVYDPPAETSGSVSFTLTIDDLDTATGQAIQSGVGLMIDITAVNDAPLLTLPGNQTVEAEDTLTLDGGDAIMISDVDVDTGELEVSLSVDAGTFSLAQITGLTFSTGTGTDDDSATFTATLADALAALDGLTFTHDVEATVTLDVAVDDQGNTGTGGAQTDSDSLTITVTAIDDGNGSDNDDDNGGTPAVIWLVLTAVLLALVRRRA